jgi:hypothetical protein
MGENGAGDRAVASGIAGDGAGPGVAEEPRRHVVLRGEMFGSVAGRERRSLWAIVSVVFVVGFAVSAYMAHPSRSGAFDEAENRAREQEQVVAATVTGKQLTKPIKGSSYDKLASKIQKSISPMGPVLGVTVWSPQGRVLFSLDESRVGTTSSDSEMRSLITGVSQLSTVETRILDGAVQVFVPVSKATDGAPAVVEVAQPLAAVDAQAGNVWSTLRVVFAFGLAVSLLLLGLSFVPSVRLAPRQGDERPEHEGQQGDEAAEMKTEPLWEPAPTEQPGPAFEEAPAAWVEEASAASVHEEPVPAFEEDEAAPPTEKDHAPSLEEEPAPSLEEELAPSAQEDDALRSDQDQAVDHETVPATGDGQAVKDDNRSDDDDGFKEMRRRLEEFKARAQQAELRVKKLAELQEASSAKRPEQ